MNYTKFFEARFKIVNKQGEVVPFILNDIQKEWLAEPALKKIELKARQEGFSSAILAKKTAKFLLMENRYIISIADIADNAMGLLDRVKYYMQAYEEITGVKIPLKYNSKYELYNEQMNNRFIIGTAENVDVGRSKTITDLHMSEAAFYRDLKRMLASVLQAVVPDGEVDIETTANGFNEFKTVWDEAVLGQNGFKPMFFGATKHYSQEFLEQKRKELGRYYQQEYPETAEEAFLTSGDPYFNSEALKWYNDNTRAVIKENLIYV